MTASSAAVGIGGLGISRSTCNGLCNEPEAATASGGKEDSTNVPKIARRQRSLANQPSFQGGSTGSNPVGGTQVNVTRCNVTKAP